MGRQKHFSARVGVSLTPQDNDLLLQLQALLQKRKQGRVTITEIVRQGLHNLAVQEGIKPDAR